MSGSAVDAAKEWLDRYLDGDVDGPELEVIHTEDLLFLSVARIETADPSWLKGRLEDASLDGDRRRHVFRCLRTGLRHHLRPQLDPG
ncbi:MAG TPA: hypothetical protein RMG48_09085 [Myxococcales bacterium LLY-WYZ-16_1]|nr:hypothetical protein [Myxococcales bacterium LLY-WYZ-16_1]